MGSVVYFATGNPHKVEEAEELLDGVEVRQLEHDLVEIMSEELTEIATHSLRALPDSAERPVFVEDSGLFIDSLGGFPGPISGFAHEKLGNDRILALLETEEDRSAYFKSVVALLTRDGDIRTFEGVTRGQIAESPRGEHGFDYDEIFIPEGEDQTLGEVTVEQKNQLSHRGKALAQLNKVFRDD